MTRPYIITLFPLPTLQICCVYFDYLLSLDRKEAFHSMTSVSKTSTFKATQFPQELVLAMPDERQALSRLESLLLQNQINQARFPELIGPDGESIALPASLVGLLKQLVHDLAQGRAV